MPLLQKYKLNITWGDQDLLNIIFHYNPGKEHKHSEHLCINMHSRSPEVHCTMLDIVIQ